MNNVVNPLEIVGLKILEDWAMFLVDENENGFESFNHESQFYESIVNVNGVVEGSLFILAQDSFLDALAKNLLGLDAEPTSEERIDAFKEMGNVLAGNFITEAYGNDCVFELLHPEVKEVSLEDAKKVGTRKLASYYLADDEPVAFSFILKTDWL